MQKTTEIYCRKLGHYLQFSYCCQEQGVLPCQQILNCWQKYGLRAEHLAHLGSYNSSAPPPAKMSYLVRLVSEIRSSIES